MLEGEVGGVKYTRQLFLILSPGFLESRDPSMALVFSPVSTCAEHRRPNGHKTAIKVLCKPRKREPKPHASFLCNVHKES